MHASSWKWRYSLNKDTFLTLSISGRFMTRKERMETLGHPATRFTNIYVKNFGDAPISEEEFRKVTLT